ncbi:MAG: ATP-binding cassette domain-containing protein [Clostridia bacterium]|nr:ATP-binding cassette domain-containing protein [Clostridia bacterium]
MLKLSNIIKNYPAGNTTVHALRGVSLEFRENEFVAILGPSGCGKTTMLNIIGGLDRYTSGDLVIGGVSTKDFDEQHWDAYRNATIGFVFQSYNLIPHLTVVENVEMALSLVGEHRKERRAKAIAALNRVGMADEIGKRPNQLSGGQMQRVAIARAIVNDPKIILADEPTGALDSELSVQVMDILAEIAKNRLVIMVTHNPELAKAYCTRIVRFKDGAIVEDTDPYESTDMVEETEGDGFDVLATDVRQELSFASQVEKQEPKVGADESANEEDKSPLEEYKPLNLEEIEPEKQKRVSNRKRRKTMKELNAETKAFFDQLGLNSLSKKKKKERPAGFKPTHMRASTAFGLSLRNLFSKFRRTFFTSFAGSIGIIGLALVLSISNGFDLYIQRMQTEMFATVPLGVYEYNVDSNALMSMMTNLSNNTLVEASYPDDDVLSLKKQDTSLAMLNIMIDSFFEGNATKNNVTQAFEDYLREMPKEYYKAISTYYGTRFNLVAHYWDSDGTETWEDVSQTPDATSVMTIATTVLGQQGQQPALWNQMVGDRSVMEEHYELLEGNWPSNKYEIMICVDANNKIGEDLVAGFGLYDLYEREETEDGTPGKILKEKGSDGTIGLAVKDNLRLSDLTKLEFKLVYNDDYYKLNPDYDENDETSYKYVIDENIGYTNSIASFMSGGSSSPWKYTDQARLRELYDSESAKTLKVSGVIRLKKGDTASFVSENAFCYTEELAKDVAQNAARSQVAAYQLSIERKLGEGLTNEQFDTCNIFGKTVKKDVNLLEHHEVMDIMGNAMHQHSSYLRAIGALEDPLYVSVYANEYSHKEKIGAYINDWEKQEGAGEPIGYFDVSEMFLENLNSIVGLVSILLIAVASISLVVSTVMIGVITANSVVERTREIGILRSLGARKADIRNVFVAETTIIGLWSGLLGVLITYILCPIISAIIGVFSGIGGLLMLNPWHAVVLIALSLVLTVLSGVLPAVGASRKNVVEALRVD